MKSVETRIEKDSMGEMAVPKDALYGASTQRAVVNFPVSGYRFSRAFIRALGLIKWGAAQANHDLGLLDAHRAALIVQAAEEVIEGKLDQHFPLDIFQTGSGTSYEHERQRGDRQSLLRNWRGKPIGSSEPVHPNDHVNMGQSSNDVIPTAIHVARRNNRETVDAGVGKAQKRADRPRRRNFDDIIKIGRTHLQDATPMRLGQEFSGYASRWSTAMRAPRKRSSACANSPSAARQWARASITHPEFAAKQSMRHLQQETGIEFRRSPQSFRSAGGKDAVVEASGQLKTIAVSLIKIANDIRWLGSGPRCGIGEIQLPATQPGCSIMPGKVNPVMCEMRDEVCAQVIGNDAAVTWSAANGNFELNVMMPVMAHNILESIRLLGNVVDAFTEKCVVGIEANEERCRELVELSMAMVTSLAPKIGYDRAAEIAKESARTGKTVREICREKKVLQENDLESALDPIAMTEPGGTGSGGG